jgi:hypothetical protein
MPLFAARALWPARDRVPLLRLGLALVAAPAVLAVLLSLASFLVMGMTESTGSAVLRETLRSAAALAVLVFAFTFTFGIAGIALLWVFARRGMPAWALTGAAMGAAAGALFGAVAMSGVAAGLVVAFALGGWAILLLVRSLARIGDAAPAARASADQADGPAPDG